MKTPDFEVRSPQTSEEWESYFNLRYEILRAPWQQPKGSETDNEEDSSIHAAIFVPKIGCIVAGRLQVLTDKPNTGQIRYMAVSANWQAKGLGARVLHYLEAKAKEIGLEMITLNARENAVDFYLKNGYVNIGEGPLLWGIIPHKICTKPII